MKGNSHDFLCPAYACGQFISSSIFAIARFFFVCIALSTVAFPVCIRAVPYSISIIRVFEVKYFQTNAPRLSVYASSVVPYKLKFVNSSRSDFLQM